MISKRAARILILVPVIAAGLALAPAGHLLAQEERCEGTVTDDQGAPLLNVKVTFQKLDTKLMAQPVKTSKKGKYFHNFLDTAMGDGYEIKAELEGYKIVQITALTMRQDGTTVTDDTYLVGQSQQGLHKVLVPAQARAVLASKGKCVVDFIMAPDDKFVATFTRLKNEKAAKEGKPVPAEGAAPAAGQAVPGAPAPVAAAPTRSALDRAKELLNDRKPAEAIAPAREAVAAEPNNAEAHRWLGGALLQVENMAEAEPELKKALELDPNTTGANFDMGMLYVKKGRLMQAIPHFEKEHELYPEALAIHQNLGKLYIDTKQYDKAVAMFESAIQINPENVEYYGSLAEAYKGMGNAEKEMETYKRMGAADPTGLAFYNLGNMMFNKSEMDKAADAYKKAIEQAPDNAAAHYQLGLCYVNLAKFKEAVAELDTFVKLKPKDPKAAEAKSLAADLRKMGG
ncbi:MAG TPA: tetratricopeptide repeat protein [Candidatus Polarisedimenticolia bacterium]